MDYTHYMPPPQKSLHISYYISQKKVSKTFDNKSLV